MNSLAQIPKASILANWFVILLLIGFFFIGTIPKLFGLSNESLSVEYRVGVLFISLLFIFISKKTFLKIQSFRFFLFFWFIYGLRIIYDLYLFPIQLYGDKTATYYLQFVFGACLLPSLALIVVLRKYQLNFDYIFKWTYGLLFFVLLTAIYFRTTSGLEGRTAGEINVGIQSVGIFGTILCLLSVYNLIAARLNFSYKLISVLGVFVGFSGVIIAASKTPFLALFIVVTLFIYLWYGRIKSFLILIFLGVIGNFFLLSILDYLNNYFNGVFLDRLLYSIAIGGDSARESLLAAALNEFLQNPFLGNAFLIQEAGYTGGYPHSIIVEAFMATGLVGGSLFLIYLFKCLIYSIKLIKKKSSYTWLSLLFLQNFIFGMVSDNLFTNDSFWIISIIIIGIYHLDIEDCNRLKIDRLNEN